MEIEKQDVQSARVSPEQPAPNQEAGQSQQDPTVRTGESPVSGQTAPPASETWVEGQPTSDADYDSSRTSERTDRR